MMGRLILLLLVMLSTFGSASESNDRPVIGILAQPADAAFGPPGTQYLIASYVKWIEAAGGIVAPIFPVNNTPAELRAAFDQVSGLVLPGGHCGFHGNAYGAGSWRLLEWAQQENDAGNHFPVWGTCQGHQQLCQFGSGAPEPSVLTKTDGTEGVILPLNITESGERSRFLRDAPSSVLDALTAHPTTINLHHYSVLAKDIEDEGSATHAFFEVVSTNVDSNGAEFVSLLEARDYPFFSSQFHPEKNAFEWSQSWEAANEKAGEAHSAPAERAMAFFARFFVNEARKCAHRLDGLKLIYEFTPERTVELAGNYEQTYIWKP